MRTGLGVFIAGIVFLLILSGNHTAPAQSNVATAVKDIPNAPGWGGEGRNNGSGGGGFGSNVNINETEKSIVINNTMSSVTNMVVSFGLIVIFVSVLYVVFSGIFSLLDN